MEKRGNAASPTRHPRSTAFLLAQVGAHAAAQFAERLRELGLTPAHSGVLRIVAASSGISQRALASLLSMVPSRLVALLDELEGRGLLERRDHAEDRRQYALHLTDNGAKMMTEIGRVARAHDDAICTSLSEDERNQLWGLLKRISEEQKLTPGVHPGYRRLGQPSEEGPSRSRPTGSRSKSGRGRPPR